jgi:DUF3037 family protein
MSTKLEARYFIVRYMYNDLRDEAANIGIVVASPAGAVTSKFLEDVTVKARADVKIDQPAIEDFRSWLRTSARDLDWQAPNVDALRTWEHSIVERAGNIVRVSEPRSVLFEDLDAEVETLFREWVAPPSPPKERSETGPRDPLGGLRREAKSAIVRIIRDAIALPRTAKQLVQDYEISGTIHRNKFDVAVMPSKTGSIRLFHHVLVLPDPEESYDQAAALARRWLDVQQKSGNHKQLTAVFYSRDATSVTPPAEATALLKHDKIRAANLDQLVDIAGDLAPQARLFPAPRKLGGGRRRRKRPSSR